MSAMVVALDEGGDRRVEVALRIVAFEHDAVVESLNGVIRNFEKRGRNVRAWFVTAKKFPFVLDECCNARPNLKFAWASSDRKSSWHFHQ